MTTAVVFGYGDVGVRCLATLLAQGVQVAQVFTHPDDPNEARWYASMTRFAAEHDIPVHLSADASGADVESVVAACAPDLIFSFYYRRMIPESVLRHARSASLNMHGSLLPAFRGRAPVNWVCVHGATQTGASLHHMTTKPDAGALVDQLAVPILPDDTAYDVFRKVCTAAELVLSRSLPGLCAGTALATALDLTAGSYYGGRRPEDGEIDWSQGALRAHNLVRAVAPPFPGARTQLAGQVLRVLRTRLDGRTAQVPAGAEPACVFVDAGHVYARCPDGSLLRLLEVEWGDQLRSLEDLRATLRHGALPLTGKGAR
jgi:methionyl-tRNA formyltransferase